MSSEIVIVNGVKFVNGIAYGPAVDLVRHPDGTLERVPVNTALGDMARQIEEQRLAHLAKQEHLRQRDEARTRRQRQIIAERAAKAAVRSQA